jgi:hypothetical protein
MDTIFLDAGQYACDEDATEQQEEEQATLHEGRPEQ